MRSITDVKGCVGRAMGWITSASSSLETVTGVPKGSHGGSTSTERTP